MAIVWRGPKEQMEALVPDTFDWLAESGYRGKVARVVQVDGLVWAVEVPGLDDREVV